MDTTAAETQSAEDTGLGPDIQQEPSPLESFLIAKAAAVTELQNTIAHLSGKEKFNRHDILKGFEKLTRLVKMLDDLGDAVVNDITNSNSRIGSLEQNLFRTSQLLTIISTVLKDKNLVSPEEMTAAWKEKVEPETKAKLAEMKAKLEEPVPTNEPS